MKRTALVAAGLLLAGLHATAYGTPPSYPANGYIGVFGDAAGTKCCIDIPPGQTATLHVIGVTGGASSGGITGAEFRIEVSPPDPAALFVWVAPPTANVVLANPMDNSAAPEDVDGLNIAFRSCQTQSGMAGDHVNLGTILVIGLTGEHQLLVKRHDRPSNADIAAPLFTLCDAPNYTAVPLTMLDGDPHLHGQEPYVFRSWLNSATCAGSSCGFVAVQPQTWSAMKQLFRD